MEIYGQVYIFSIFCNIFHLANLFTNFTNRDILYKEVKLMIINYDIERLDGILQDFSNACGINIIIVDINFSPLNTKWSKNNRYCYAIQSTKYGKQACSCSDRKLFEKCRASRKAEVQICHAGLVDVAVPIIFNDDILAYIILGQMKKGDDFSLVSKYLKNIPIENEKMAELYEDLPLFDADRIDSIANIATMVAKYIMLEAVLKPESNIIIERATNFIEKNLGDDLSIETLSNRLNICRSALYKNFEIKFSCTPGEYIKARRIEKSKDLLINSDLSIESISEQVGFSSGAYFSHVFKALTGSSPLSYRKTQRISQKNYR